MRYLEPIVCGSYHGYKLWFGDRLIIDRIYEKSEDAHAVLKLAQEGLRLLDETLKGK